MTAALAHVRRAEKDVRRVESVLMERKYKGSLYATNVEMGWLNEALSHLSQAKQLLKEEDL